MIVDCHIHLWHNSAQLGRAADGVRHPTARADEPLPEASLDQYLGGARAVDRTIVLGIASRHLGAELPHRQIAEVVRSSNGRLIGFAGIDPTDRDAGRQLREAREEHGLLGVGLCPAACDCHPADTRAMRLYETACALKMPVVFHRAGLMAAPSRLDYARPALIDEVARAFPELRIVVSHVGRPWAEECLMLLAKHPGVYSDIAGLLERPWPAFNLLLSANSGGVIDKLLFASGFPFAAPAVCIEALYSINHLAHGTNLPTIPRERLRSIVERDAIALLGLPGALAPSRPAAGGSGLTRTDE